MTPQEYNRDVKRLRNFVKSADNSGTVLDKESHIKSEINRLYHADDTFTIANKASVLTLLRLNLRFRAMQPFCFGQL